MGVVGLNLRVNLGVKLGIFCLFFLFSLFFIFSFHFSFSLWWIDDVNHQHWICSTQLWCKFIPCFCAHCHFNYVSNVIELLTGWMKWTNDMALKAKNIGYNEDCFQFAGIWRNSFKVYWVFCGFAKKAIHPFLDGSFFSASCKYKALNLSPKWKASCFLNYAGLEGNFLLLWYRGRRFLHYKVGNCAKSENLLNDHLRVNFEFKMLQEYILMYILTILEVWGTVCHSSIWFFFWISLKFSRRLPNLITGLGKRLPKLCRSIFMSSAGLLLVARQ
jgi:hypothetical protein